MNIGCLEDCIFVSDKQSSKTVVHSQKKEGDATTNESLTSSSSRIGKNKSSKDTSPSALNALNKFTSQIKKPPHRKSSPLNWFPRKKIDSYLERKIKMLQEVDGINLTLDETLGDSNPHYCRVLREKMAAREAAHKAMEAHKAALVEASWCRILQAARIQSKEAEDLLLKAEKTAAEAFESATALGVIMYDIPNCPRSTCQVETSSINRAGSTTHTIRASFETAFEVDKQVAAAVKTAFMRLACCPPSFNKDEFKDLPRKINENPDTGNSNLESIEFSSECKLEPGSELETLTQKEGFKSQEFNCKMSAEETRQRKLKRRHSLEKFNMEKLVEMMLERLKCLQEDELSSLATIVATCGLNAALAEVENTKQHNPCSIADHPSASALNFVRRMSSIGAGTVRKTNQTGQVDSELPSLDKFLVKHMTKLEREVQEARSRRNESKDEGGYILAKESSSFEEEIRENEKNFKENSGVDLKNSDADTSVEDFPDLGSILVKHSSKLEKEIHALAEVENTKQHNPCSIADHPSASALNFVRRTSSIGAGTVRKANQTGQVDSELPSLDKFLVKHMTKLEREVQEARSRRNESKDEGGYIFAKESSIFEEEIRENEKNLKENSGVDLKNSDADTSVEDFPDLGSILVKHSSKLEKEIQEAKRNCGKTYELNGKKRRGMSNGVLSHKKGDILELPSLDEFLVKHVSRLEREVKEAKNRRKNDLELSSLANLEKEVLSEKHVPCSNGEVLGKENTNLNKEVERNESEDSLAKILVKPVHRLEREKLQAYSSGSNYGNPRNHKKQGGTYVTDCESLDKVLVKHVSRVEKEKMRFNANEEVVKVKRGSIKVPPANEDGSLDQVLVKHKSGLEKEKMAAAEQPKDQIRFSVSRREARERELQEAWGGLSLGNSIQPHLSRLERDKAAWRKAEEEERMQAAKKEV